MSGATDAGAWRCTSGSRTPTHLHSVFGDTARIISYVDTASTGMRAVLHQNSICNYFEVKVMLKEECHIQRCKNTI